MTGRTMMAQEAVNPTQNPGVVVRSVKKYRTRMVQFQPITPSPKNLGMQENPSPKIFAVWKNLGMPLLISLTKMMMMMFPPSPPTAMRRIGANPISRHRHPPTPSRERSASRWRLSTPRRLIRPHRLGLSPGSAIGGVLPSRIHRQDRIGADPQTPALGRERSAAGNIWPSIVEQPADSSGSTRLERRDRFPWPK